MQGTFTVRMKRWWKEATDGFALANYLLQPFRYFGRFPAMAIIIEWLTDYSRAATTTTTTIINYVINYRAIPTVGLLHEVCMGRLNSSGSKY